MKANDMNFNIRQLNLTLFGSMLLCLFNYAVAAIEDEDPHRHHRREAMSREAEVLVRSTASYKIPEVKVVESNGKVALLSQAIRNDKPVMLNFIFTTCTAICPVMSASFSQVAQQLDAKQKSVQLVSISVDPEQDTPARLAEYAMQFGASAQWRLYTATAANSILIQRAFDAYRGDKMNHAPLTFIRGANSRQWIRIEGLASAAELMREFRALPAE